MTRHRFALQVGLVAAAGLAFRVWYVLAEHRHDNYFGDAWAYHRGAVLLAHGHGFVDAFRFDLAGGVERAGAAHPPLYTLYLAAWSLIGIDGPLQHRLVTTLLGAATIVVVAYVARRLAGDRAGIVATGLPLFAAGVVPTSPASNGPGVVGAPVVMGGQHVRPGDIVVGDEDGVVIVPLDRAAAVLERLAAIRVAEAKAIAAVESGATATDRIRAIVAGAKVIGP